MMSAKAEKWFDLAEQIQSVRVSLDSVLAILSEESHTEDNQLAKIDEQIGTVKARLSSVLDPESSDSLNTIASCAKILDDSIRLAKQASVVSLRQAQLIQSLCQIQSLLRPCMSNKRSNSKASPSSPSPANSEPTAQIETLPAGKEGRQHKRVPLETEVNFVGDTNFYTGFVEDISDGGLYVSTFNLLPIGTYIELSFTLPSGHQIKVPGQVRWVRDPIIPDENSSPGMGIMFEKLAIEDKKQIDDFIERRSPLFYDEDL
jgi:uncharacterized protein (TIGR02266 family)